MLSGDDVPSFITLDDNGDGTGTLTLQPGFDDSGDYTITVRATDSGSLTDQQSFALSVTDVNRASVLTAIGDQTIAEDQTRVIALNATDADGDAVVLSGDDVPSFITLDDNGDGTGTLTLQPGFDDSGDYTITVRATDSGSLSDQQSFALSVTDVNRAPTLAAIGDQTIEEDQTRVIALNATDADGDDIILSGNALPSFASVNDNADGTGTLALQPSFGDAGTYALVLRSTDADVPTLFTETTVQVTVRASTSNQVAAENEMPGTADWHLKQAGDAARNRRVRIGDERQSRQFDLALRQHQCAYIHP